MINFAHSYLFEIRGSISVSIKVNKFGIKPSRSWISQSILSTAIYLRRLFSK